MEKVKNKNTKENNGYSKNYNSSSEPNLPKKEILRMEVDPKSLIFNKEKRIRQTYSHIDIVLDSMNKVGQIYDILIDENREVHVGGTKYLASVKGDWKKVKVEMRTGLSEDEWYLLELHENLMRKNLDRVERAVGLARAKGIYERLYPETKQHVRGGKSGGKSRSKIATNNLSGAILTNSTQPEVPESFANLKAKEYGVHPKTIRRDVKLGRAILEKQIDDNTIEDLRRKKISDNEVFGMLKKTKKENLLGKKAEISAEIVDKRLLPHYICKNAQIVECCCEEEKHILCKKELGKETIKLKPLNSPKCKNYHI